MFFFIYYYGDISRYCIETTKRIELYFGRMRLPSTYKEIRVSKNNVTSLWDIYQNLDIEKFATACRPSEMMLMAARTCYASAVYVGGIKQC